MHACLLAVLGSALNVGDNLLATLLVGVCGMGCVADWHASCMGDTMSVRHQQRVHAKLVCTWAKTTEMPLSSLHFNPNPCKCRASTVDSTVFNGQADALTSIMKDPPATMPRRSLAHRPPTASFSDTTITDRQVLVGGWLVANLFHQLFHKWCLAWRGCARK